ncbi:MAG: arsenate reductase ArsC [Candidatus Omnitrophota bacterium]
MKKVLFLCTGNSARSQIAEGLLRHMAKDKFEVFSAGINPTQLNPLAIEVMAEIGVDISKQRSKSIREFLDKNFDYVITLCDNAKQTCPVFPGNYKMIHWNIEDPAGFSGGLEDKYKLFRRIRDEIKKHIIAFLNQET